MSRSLFKSFRSSLMRGHIIDANCACSLCLIKLPSQASDCDSPATKPQKHRHRACAAFFRRQAPSQAAHAYIQQAVDPKLSLSSTAPPSDMVAKRKAEAAGGKQAKKQAKTIAAAEPAPAAAATAPNGDAVKPLKNKEKVLLLSSRGVTFRCASRGGSVCVALAPPPPPTAFLKRQKKNTRYRHLLTDLLALLPHGKKDAKLDTKRDRGVINEACDMKGCTSALFFEVRKRADLYLWLSKVPGGPSAKLLVQAVHTTSELKLTGNHLRGSRPVLSFDASFDAQPHWQLLKEMLTQVCWFFFVLFGLGVVRVGVLCMAARPTSPFSSPKQKKRIKPKKQRCLRARAATTSPSPSSTTCSPFRSPTAASGSATTR